MLDVDFILLDAVDELFLILPLGFVIALLFLELGNVLVELGNALLVAVALDGLALNLQLRNLSTDFVQSLRHRVHLDA